MGYTNYWHKKRSFTDKEWEQIFNEYLYVLDLEMIEPIQLENKKAIAFNGKGQSCESFYLEKDLEEYFKCEHMGKYYKEQFDKQGYHFNFCKTRMFQYDLSVWYLCVAMSRISPKNITINRDR